MTRAGSACPRRGQDHEGASRQMLLDSSVARAVVRELPDAFNPAWGTSTWAGRFGTKALRAEVTAMNTALTLSARGVTGTSTVRGRVFGEPATVFERLRSLVGGGDEAARGRFAHTLTLHDTGRLEAHHTVLKLDRGSRGSGFATGFVDHARERYAAAGIDDATMFAGMSVGGYAWAREGLELMTNEVDEVARALDRGRKLARIVDGARHRIDLSGAIPRVGRRITEAQHAAIAPRLVRGNVLPPDALTSMRELAAIPEIGRSVLLGHMWKGSAEIDRVAPWWARNGAHATAQAAEGLTYRSAPTVVATESRAAAHRIAASMPAAVDPFRASATLARHLAGTGAAPIDDAADAAQAVVRVALDRATPTVETSLPVLTAAGRRIELRVAWDGAKLVATEQIPLRGRDAGVRRALDAAWRELGVDQVRSAWTGLRRNVQSATPAP